MFKQQTSILIQYTHLSLFQDREAEPRFSAQQQPRPPYGGGPNSGFQGSGGSGGGFGGMGGGMGGGGGAGGGGRQIYVSNVRNITPTAIYLWFGYERLIYLFSFLTLSDGKI